MILSAFLINLKCRWFQSGLADLEKHQTLAFLHMVNFYAFLKPEDQWSCKRSPDI